MFLFEAIHIQTRTLFLWTSWKIPKPKPNQNQNHISKWRVQIFKPTPGGEWRPWFYKTVATPSGFLEKKSPWWGFDLNPSDHLGPQLGGYVVSYEDNLSFVVWWVYLENGCKAVVFLYCFEYFFKKNPDETKMGAMPSSFCTVLNVFFNFKKKPQMKSELLCMQ
jgi:hypothetical protein